MCDKEPTLLVTAKNGGSPIIVGQGEKQAFLASDIPAVLPYTRDIISLHDGDFAVLTEDGIQVVDIDGRPLDREFQVDPMGSGLRREGRLRPLHAEGDLRAAPRHHRHDRHARQRGRARCRPRRHRVHARRSSTVCRASRSSPAAPRIMRRCVGKYMIEQLAGIPCEVDLASEFRYRKPIVGARRIVIPVSQSGETADTLAALRGGRSGRARACWRSATCGSRRSRARATTCSTHTRGPRSASRRRRPS